MTSRQLFGVDVGPAMPLRFVTTHPHPVRLPGLTVTRVTVLPERWNDLVVIPEHCWLSSSRK